jgi:hypothetical protein
VFNEVIALLSVFSAFFALLLAFRIYRKAPPWIDEKIEGLMSTFLEPDEEGKNIVDHLASRFGQGFRMSLLAQKSGEVRHEQAIEKRVFEAAVEKSPELKIGLKVLEEFGLGDLATPENLPALLKIANKYGLFSMIGGNSPGKNPSQGVM